MDIEKTIAKSAGEYIKIKIITERINDIKSDGIEDKTRLLKKQLQDLQSASQAKDDYWLHVRGKRYDKLMGQFLSIKHDFNSNLEVLEIERASLQAKAGSTKGMFQSLGEAFIIGERAIRIVFLICLAVLLELMVYGSSTAEIGTPKKSRKGKKNDGQIRMVM